MRRRRATLAGALIAASIGAGGCAGIEGGEGSPPPGNSGGQGADSTPSEAPGGQGAESAPSGGQSPRQPSGPPVQGEDGALRLRLGQLRRTASNTVTVNFTIENASDGIVVPVGQFSEDRESEDDGSVDGAYLVDERGGKKYLVLLDERNFCLCSREIGGFSSGEVKGLFAKFPAPPPGVESVSVTIAGFPSIDNVPIAG